MARKCGKKNVLHKKFSNYNYIINGEGDVGKTTLAYELGKAVANSDEGTFIIVVGKENKPKHIDGVFFDEAPKFEKVDEYVEELCENKAEFPDTVFVAFDSLDELFRIAEDYVVREWNRSCPADKRCKSISGAYGGYQAGNRRVMDLIGKMLERLEAAGYQVIFIGHTKKKNKTDMQTGIEYETITCNLDNNYYTFIKDKVNLVGTAYKERVITNIESKKNPFTKKNVEVGSLVSEKRVMSFIPDGFCLDTKSHFPFIVPKINLDAKEFIAAVEKAIVDEAEWRAKHPGQTPNVINPYAEAEEKVIASANAEESSDDLDGLFDDDEVDEIKEETEIKPVKEDTAVEPIKEETEVEELTAESDDVDDIFADDDDEPAEAEQTLTKEDKVKLVREKATANADIKKLVREKLNEKGCKLSDLSDSDLDELIKL